MAKLATDLTPKARRTRSSLIEAAQTIIGVGGVSGVTVMEVCDTAGVGRTSFYNYFDDVSALIENVALEAAEAVKFRFDQLHDGQPRGLLRLEKCLVMIQTMASDEPESMLLLTSLAQTVVSIPNMLQREFEQELDGAELEGSLHLTDLRREALIRFLTISTLALSREMALGRIPKDQIGQQTSILLCACQAG